MERQLFDQIGKLSDERITRIVMHKDDFKVLLAELQPAEPAPKGIVGIPIPSFTGINIEVSDLIPQGQMLFFHASGVGTRIVVHSTPRKQPTEGPYADIAELHYALGGWDAYDADGNLLMRFPPEVVEESDWLSQLRRTRESWF